MRQELLLLLPFVRAWWHEGQQGLAKHALQNPGIVATLCSAGLWILGTGMEVLQDLRKFRVRVWKSTELTQVPGKYTNVAPLPRVLWHGGTNVRKFQVSGKFMNAVNNPQKLWVRVRMLYRTHRSSGCG